MAVQKILPKATAIEFEMVKLAAAAAFGVLPYRSDFLDITGILLPSIHIYGVGLSGLTVDVEMSNVATVGLAEVIAANVAANKVVPLTQGGRYVQLVLKTLTSGSFGATFSGTLP